MNDLNDLSGPDLREAVARFEDWTPRRAECARWIAYQWYKGHKRYVRCFGEGDTILDAIEQATRHLDHSGADKGLA